MAASRALAVEAAREMLDLSLLDLWVDYFGLGGTLLPEEIERFLLGGERIGDRDHDMLVQALNEHFLERGENHPLAYADELVDDDR
jgi:hypothetical protein